MNAVANLLRHMIGSSKNCVWRTQVELAQEAGLTPSTVNGMLKAKTIEPATLGKVLKTLPERHVRCLLAAAVRDAIPAEFATMVFSDDRVMLNDTDAQGLLSPLADRMLSWLRQQAIRDPLAEQSLETQAKWVGLDKE